MRPATDDEEPATQFRIKPAGLSMLRDYSNEDPADLTVLRGLVEEILTDHKMLIPGQMNRLMVQWHADLLRAAEAKAPKAGLITGAQLAEWKASGFQYKVIAAAIATWAEGRERGTALPDNAEFAGELPLAVTQGTFKRAKAFLADQGVLYRNDGPWQVA